MVKNKTKIVVAMSGGVDSSVVAALLKKNGFLPAGRQVDVVGIFMKFWLAPRSLGEGGEGINRCCSVESEKLARAVAKKIGIPFYVVNVEKEFKKKVVDYFLKEYKKGNTPNPCVVCNKEIKFGFLIKKALSLGADYIATGHYAQIKNGKLLKGADKEKDQSYFLWQLDQKQLSHVLFPVGGYTKPEVRKLAKKFKLPTAETPESMEICFTPNGIDNFLEKYLKQKPGKIVDINGKILGTHNGSCHYTIGQRKGIGFSGGPFWVLAKNLKKNQLIVTKNEKDLYQKKLIAKNVNWISGKEPESPIKVQAKIRYRSPSVSAEVFKLRASSYSIQFAQNQRAITPGQSVVFYKNNELVGGGIIQ